jgi:cytochrome c oxidase subunit 2
MVVVAVIGCVILIPIALVIPWFPTEASTQAGNIHTLYDVLLIASVPIAVVVLTVVGFSVWKFRMRPGQEKLDGPPIHGNTRLEIVWTIVPAVLILGLCSYAYAVLRDNEANKVGALTVRVVERQFAFQFGYPQSGGKVVYSPTLVLPKDRPVLFKLTSLDVIHSFFVPEFSVKIDAVPGIVTDLRATPTALGSYPAECTELCGAGHSLMRAPVRVVTPSQFNTWLTAAIRANIPPPIGTNQPPPGERGK